MTVDFLSFPQECQAYVGQAPNQMPQTPGAFSQDWFDNLSADRQGAIVAWVLIPALGTTKRAPGMGYAIRDMAPWLTSRQKEVVRAHLVLKQNAENAFAHWEAEQAANQPQQPPPGQGKGKAKGKAPK